MRGGLEITFLRFEDIRHKRLRVSIDNREPAALHLHHHTMSFLKGVILCVQTEAVFKYGV